MTLAHSWGRLQGWAEAWVGSDCCPALWCPRLRLRAQGLHFGAETRHPLPSGVGKPPPHPQVTGERFPSGRQLAAWSSGFVWSMLVGNKVRLQIWVLRSPWGISQVYLCGRRPTASC